MSIYKKLAEARIAFHAMDIKKSGESHTGKYFELGDIVEPAVQCLHANGLSAFVSYGNDLAVMEVRDYEGEHFLITSPMSTANLRNCHEVQNLGAVQTYLRRYLWMTLMEVVETDTAEMMPATSELPRKLASDEKMAQIRDYHDADKLPPETVKWLETYNWDITDVQADRLLKKLSDADS